MADTYTFPGDKGSSLYPRWETISTLNKFHSCNYGNSGMRLTMRRKEWFQRSLLVNTWGECRPVLQNIDYLYFHSFAVNILYISIFDFKLQSCCNTAQRKPINIAQHTMYTDFIFKYEDKERGISAIKRWSGWERTAVESHAKVWY